MFGNLGMALMDAGVKAPAQNREQRIRSAWWPTDFLRCGVRRIEVKDAVTGGVTLLENRKHGWKTSVFFGRDQVVFDPGNQFFNSLREQIDAGKFEVNGNTLKLRLGESAITKMVDAIFG